MKNKSLIKAISWEMLMFIFTSLLAWLFFQNINEVLLLNTIMIFIKIPLLYLHDVLWNKKLRGME